MRKTLNLEAQPLQIISGADAKTVYFLTPGKILIYSLREERIVDFLPVDRKFDKVSLSGKDKVFILSSSKDNSISIFELKKTLDLSGLPFRGAPDAPVVVAVFSDYQWPYCGRIEPLLQQVLEKYPQEVKVVFKNFPLSFHDYARQAATAALAAAAQGKFWEFNDLLFKSPPLNDQKIQEIARGLKLDMTAFNASLKDPAIQKLIDRDLAEGREMEVQGTPTVFVNGNELEELSLQGLTRMIEAELGRR